MINGSVLQLQRSNGSAASVGEWQWRGWCRVLLRFSNQLGQDCSHQHKHDCSEFAMCNVHLLVSYPPACTSHVLCRTFRIDGIADMQV